MKGFESYWYRARKYRVESSRWRYIKEGWWNVTASRYVNVSEAEAEADRGRRMGLVGAQGAVGAALSRYN